MKLITALATTCALLSAPAFAQSATTLSKTGATPTSPAISTPEFVNKAIESNMFDVRAARMAEQKGDSPDRSFARPDVLGHTKVTDDLKMMVNTGKVNAKIPSALDSDQQAKLDELGHLWGKSFDDAYSRDQRESHQSEIALFQQYAQNGDNPALKQWATEMLPELKSHLITSKAIVPYALGSHVAPARASWLHANTAHGTALGRPVGVAIDTAGNTVDD
jgi:putative membrane protein